MAIELNGKARSGESQIFEWLCRTKDGTLFWTEISLRFTQFGNTPAMVGIVRDIAERKRMDAQIVYMAQHDLLTGLANRSMFMTALDQAIAQSLRTGKMFAVLCLDLDHFKDVNDLRGHLTGDRLLRIVAERLRAVVRLNENVARFGGDEFAILLSDLSDPAEIAALAARLIVSIGNPFSIDGIDIHVGASIGVAVYGENACDAETLLSQADIALYRAKAEGRRDHLQRLTKMFRHAASWASRPLCRGDRVHPTGQGLRGIGSGSRTRTARQSYGRAKRSGRTRTI